jgi:hypothetical protein
MNRPIDDCERRERLIAALLWYGTWAASAVIAAGLAVGLTRPISLGLSGIGIAQAGVALFILLPVARVVLMLGMFLRQRDYAYAAISAFVLAIIAAGFVAAL